MQGFSAERSSSGYSHGNEQFFGFKFLSRFATHSEKVLDSIIILSKIEQLNHFYVNHLTGNNFPSADVDKARYQDW